MNFLFIILDKITDKGLFFVQKLIENSKKLEELNLLLANTGITDEGLIYLCRGLENSKKLEVLNLLLANTGITNEGL